MEVKEKFNINKIVNSLFILTQIIPIYSYKGKSKKMKQTRTLYIIACPALFYLDFTVSVKGKQTIPNEVIKENSYPLVEFDNLDVKVEVLKRGINIFGEAKGIHLIE